MRIVIGVCNSANQTCVETRRPNFGSSTGKGGVLCALLYDNTVKTAAISGGVVAGIVIGAVAGAALIGFGGYKGYDYLMAKNSAIGGVAVSFFSLSLFFSLCIYLLFQQNNPLYSPSGYAGENALYKG